MPDDVHENEKKKVPLSPCRYREEHICEETTLKTEHIKHLQSPEQTRITPVLL